MESDACASVNCGVVFTAFHQRSSERVFIRSVEKLPTRRRFKTADTFGWRPSAKFIEVAVSRKIGGIIFLAGSLDSGAIQTDRSS
jgi:hypothetical protein